MLAGDTRQCRQRCPPERGHSAGRGQGPVSAPCPALRHAGSQHSGAGHTQRGQQEHGGSRSQRQTDMTQKALPSHRQHLPSAGWSQVRLPWCLRRAPGCPQLRSAGTRRCLRTGDAGACSGARRFQLPAWLPLQLVKFYLPSWGKAEPHTAPGNPQVLRPVIYEVFWL